VAKPSLNQLTAALRRAWSAETSFDASAWTPDNPARGQCVASSLVVQSYFGGDLLRYRAIGPGIAEMHYCNVLDDGTILDTTGQQYKEPITLEVLPVDLKGFTTIREKRLADKITRDKYKLLLSRVATFLDTSTSA
jgi:hypothetical protein